MLTALIAEDELLVKLGISSCVPWEELNIAVVGEKGSYFDGCNCYDPEGEQNYRGPHGMSIWRCRNIRLEGYQYGEKVKGIPVAV